MTVMGAFADNMKDMKEDIYGQIHGSSTKATERDYVQKHTKLA